MFRNATPILSVFVLSLFLGACAAKPTHVEPIAATADSAQEIELTARMISEAKEQNLDILAPKSYERAQESLADARQQMVKGKNKEKVLKNIADARGWLEEAKNKGDVTRAVAKDLPDARRGAIRANAASLYPKEFEKLEKRALSLGKDGETGSLVGGAEEGDKLTADYRELEVKALTKGVLGEAQVNLEAAKKENAPKHAPKTFQVTETKINNTMALIKENPRDTAAIRKAAADAVEQSKFLLVVAEKTKQGNTEDLVLQTEKQRRMISGLSQEQATTEANLATTEADLAQKTTALKTAEQIRSQFKPNEAEVYVEGNAVKVRLKGLQFASNKATLNKKSTALLEKVDKALGTVGASQITVEGYTDNVGNDDTNRSISQKRAEAVQGFIVSKGRLPAQNVKAVGRGEENPVSDNETPRGRAENRRIDLLIEPSTIE